MPQQMHYSFEISYAEVKGSPQQRKDCLVYVQTESVQKYLEQLCI